MSKLQRTLLAIGSLFILLGGGFIAKFLIDYQSPAFGSLQVDAIPKTAVYLDGQEVGQTPLVLEKIKTGEYNLKLASWETKVKIGINTLTYVSREIGATTDLSSGQVLTLEKLPGPKTVELTIVSDPDQANILFDGLEKGKTSVLFTDIPAGDHTIVISLSGYADQVIQSRLVAGYRLNALVKLRPLNGGQNLILKPTSEVVASPAAEVKPLGTVSILPTPLGYLRVRFGPDLAATEAGKAKPGETYPLLEETDGWVKLKFNDLDGWVSDQYVSIKR